MQRPNFSRAAVALAALLSVVSAALPSSVPTAFADVTITLDGHGYGHGVGLSQWGAYGYAVDHGWTATQILDHYYGGTASGTIPTDTPVTVWLQAIDNYQTAVVSATGGLVIDGVVGGPWKSVLARWQGSAYQLWVRADAEVCPGATGTPAGWTLLPGSATSPVIRTQKDSSTATAYSDLAGVCSPGGEVRSYRGAIQAVAAGTRTINIVPMEQYLRSVIAKEMSPSWANSGAGKGAQALQAQAVAARSYAQASNHSAIAKTCDSTQCQAYYGAALRSSLAAAFSRVEYPSTDAAVLATAGVVRTSGAAVALTMFAASSGGWTAPSAFPAVVDEGDATAANPNHNWSTVISGAVISARFPSIGTFASMAVSARNGSGDWGGRVTQVRLTGSAGSVLVTGDAFKSALGLKSNWFNVRGAPLLDPCLGRNAPAVGGAMAAAAASRFVASNPVRLVDTRVGLGTAQAPLLAGCTLVVHTGLPAAATAAVVNLTAVGPVTGGYLTAYPCGVGRPTVSAVQVHTGQVTAGSSVVPLAADGTFCVYSSTTLHLVVDLDGSYSTSEGVPFEPMNPVRVYDSRLSGSLIPAGSVVHVAVVRPGGAPSGATVAALTLHAMNAMAGGFATAYPCTAALPPVSSINVAPGAAFSNHVETALSATGELCVFVSGAMHIVVDLDGWFGVGATTQYHAIVPVRVLDSRPSASVGLSGPFAPGSTRSVAAAGVFGIPGAPSVKALVGTVTAVLPAAAGDLTVDACVIPATGLASLHYAAMANVATTVISAEDPSGHWCITSTAQSNVLVDVSGYFA